MSISYRATPAVTQSSGNVSSFAVNKQAGTASGDHIFIFLFGGPTGTTACSGFSFTPDSNNFAAIFHRVADGTEGSSFTVTNLDGGDPVTAAIVTIAGANSALDPATIATPTSGGAATSIPVGSITLGSSGDLVLWFAANENGFGQAGYAITPPSGFASQATNGAQAANATVMVADNSSLGSGATGTKTGTFTSSSYYSGVMVGLTAATGGGGGGSTVNATIGMSGGSTLGLSGANTGGGGGGTHPSWDSGSWTETFSDEFTGTSLDTTKWQPAWFKASGTSGPVNSTEIVTYNSANVSVSGGYLNLKLSGSYGAVVTTNPQNSPTAQGFQFSPPVAYEWRAYLPADSNGQVANWPATWSTGHSWPGTGEIDCMEGLHGQASGHFTDSGHYPTFPGFYGPTTPGWHTFGVFWTNNSVTFYYDGVQMGTGAYATDGFTGPHYLVADNTTDRSVVNGTMQVDWVRVWTPGGSGGGGSAPGAPTGLTATGETNTTVSLSWTAPTGTVTGYAVYQGGIQVATTTSTSYTVTGLSAGTTYSFTVAAYNSNGTGIQSSSISATTTGTSGGGTPPAAPTGLTATGETSSTVSLTWTAPSGTVTGYYIYINGAQAGPITGTSYVASGLAAATTYSFTVAAYNANGTGSQSSSVNATTSGSGSNISAVAAILLPGNLLTLADSDFESGSFTWTADTNATAPNFSSSYSFTGAQSLGWSASAAGDSIIATGYYPCTGNNGYAVSGYINTPSTAHDTYIGVRWYDINHNHLSDSWGNDNPSTQNIWQPNVAAVTSPSNARYFKVAYWVSSNVTAGEMFAIDLVYAADAVAQVVVDWVNPAFQSGSLSGQDFCDLTPFVRLDQNITISRGRQDAISEIQTGQAQFQAVNDSGWFTPLLSTSPWYPNVTLGKRVQINACDENGNWHTRFDGPISEIAYTIDGTGNTNAAAISCSDVLAELNRQDPLLAWTAEMTGLDSPWLRWRLDDAADAGVATETSGNNGPVLRVVDGGGTIAWQSTNGGVEMLADASLPAQPDGSAYWLPGSIVPTSLVRGLASGTTGPIQPGTTNSIGQYIQAALGNVYFTPNLTVQSAQNQFVGTDGYQLQANLLINGVPATIAPNATGSDFTVEAWYAMDPAINTNLGKNLGPFTVLSLGSSRNASCLVVGLYYSGASNLNFEAATYSQPPAYAYSAYGTNPSAVSTTSARVSADLHSVPHHVVLEFTGASGGGSLAVYLDNNLVGTITLPNGQVYDFLCVGGAYGGHGNFYGAISCVSIYNYLLSPAQIERHCMVGQYGFWEQTTDNCIAAIAEMAGIPRYWNNVGGTDSYLGLSMTEYLNISGQTPLSSMQVYEQAEQGLLFVNSSGQLTFHTRDWRQGYGAPDLTLPADSYNADLGYELIDTMLLNEAAVSTPMFTSGADFANPASQAVYGTYANGTANAPIQLPLITWSRAYANLGLSSYGFWRDPNLTDNTSWQANTRSSASLICGQLTVDLLTPDPSWGINVSNLYALDIDNMVTLGGQPASFPNQTGALDYFVEGFNEVIGQQARSVTLYTSPAVIQRAWKPGDPIYGQLGVTSRIGVSAPDTAAPAALGKDVSHDGGPPYWPPQFSATPPPALGVYRGPLGQCVQDGAAGATGAGIAAYEGWTGVPCKYVLDYIYNTPSSTTAFTAGHLAASNGAGTDSGLTLSGWQGNLGNRTLMLGVPACIGSHAGAGANDWAGEAAGNSDTYWTALGTNLISWGLGNSVLRIGREFNFSGYSWSVASSGNNSVANYIAGYQHIVSLLRGLPGANFTFMWNPAIGYGNNGVFSNSNDVTNAYPGDAYVDVIGLDAYDWAISGHAVYATQTTTPYQTPVASLQEQNWANNKSLPDGIIAWQTFATAHGKPLAYPEWGLVLWTQGSTYIAGGDDPYFIQQMFANFYGVYMSAMWEDNGVGLFDTDASSHRIANVPLPDASRTEFLSLISGTSPMNNPANNGHGFIGANDIRGLRNTLSTCLNPPILVAGCINHQQSVATGNQGTSGHAIWDTVFVDTAGGMGAVPGYPNWYCVTTPGFYEISASIDWTTQSSGAAGVRTAWIIVAQGAAQEVAAGTGSPTSDTYVCPVGEQVNNVTGGNAVNAPVTRLYLGVGDMVNIGLMQTQGSALTTATGHAACNFSLRWVGYNTSADQVPLALNPGSGLATVVAGKTTYVQSWNATGCYSYYGTKYVASDYGGIQLRSNSQLYQGELIKSVGSQFALVMFPNSAIQSALVGATIKRVWVTFKNVGTHQKTGGYMMLGYTTFVGTPGNTFTPGGGTHFDLRRIFFKPGQTKQADITGAGIGSVFQGGTATGLTIGNNKTTSPDDACAWVGNTNPVLTIEYVK